MNYVQLQFPGINMTYEMSVYHKWKTHKVQRGKQKYRFHKLALEGTHVQIAKYKVEKFHKNVKKIQFRSK